METRPPKRPPPTDAAPQITGPRGRWPDPSRSAPTPAHLLDTAALWDSLTAEQQRDVGIAAVAQTAAAMGMMEGDEPAVGWEAAFEESAQRLEALLADALPQPPRRPDLANIGVRACDGCGCTDSFACDDGCSWVAEHLCSSCAGGRLH
jgi:hypothetical protein